MQPRVRDLGLTEYTAVWEAMRRFTDRRTEATADEIWLLEHPPVFTLGLGGKEKHLLDPGAIPVVRCDRGGQVTYHGPGQLVVYVLADLRRMGWGVKRFVNALEQAVIDLCETWRILARRRSGAPGVYLDGAKVAAVGLRVRRGCTFHGLALNVNMDLSPFRRINPCGYAGLRVTQLYDQGVAESMSVVKEPLVASLLDNLGYDNQFNFAPRGMNPVGRPKGRAAPLPFGNPMAKDRAARPRGINLTRSLGREDRSSMSLDETHPSLTGRRKIAPTTSPALARKPPWIRARLPVAPSVLRLKKLLRERRLHTVCEEAACPNLGECFAHGTATFMILGDICTRCCPFCDVAHGRPGAVDPLEPQRLAEAVAVMGLSYVVITSVDRDDLEDRGAGHFAACIAALRQRLPELTIEILVPDFRRRMELALERLYAALPDVFNHNLETVPRLYRRVRPGADYAGSLHLLQRFKQAHALIPTKSGLMLGLGETLDEVKQTLQDLRAHACDMLTLGQYLQPSRYHLPVERFVTPDEFRALGDYAKALGFSRVASGPMVRSSYHADRQARGDAVGAPGRD